MGIKEILTRKARRDLRKAIKLKKQQNMEIRDSLAMERTKLANERTFLSYERTAVAMILGGLTFIKLFDDLIYVGLGILAIPAGIAIGVFGYMRFSRKRSEILHHTRAYTPTSPVLAEVDAEEEDEEEQNRPASK
ncbi:DUF202 domain-containing protein [Pontibacter qinzhouensis]|uniref:DUF202 domain-containing protein n=1 Tax=Pontibacter qinzhouensis TaxID=2603253 RepID=A0A5C8KBP5_9BACT|nr:DUF202 domain-containing protein [Pontibacter qinzhouensis]TXK52816.1 DUF202 domain-containing protein [Pontibacter qinzhouensis]